MTTDADLITLRQHIADGLDALERHAREIERLTAERDAIRAATIEECAKVAEAFPARLLAMWDRPGGPPGNGYVDVNGQAYIAEAMRAIAKRPS